MRFLADECFVGQVVRQLRLEGHDVAWVREDASGASDEEILKRSVAENRIVLTHDWDFGDLVVHLGRPANGVVIVSASALDGDKNEAASRVTQWLSERGSTLEGFLTILEAARTRQRKLGSQSVLR